MTKATQWPCRGCGAMLTGRGGKRYCGPDCRPRCAVENCGAPVHTRGFCGKHAMREATYGDPEAPLLRQKNVGDCSVEGCEDPMRKAGLCASHCSQKRRFGEVRPWRHKWADVSSPCTICGQIVEPGSGRRKHCSEACQAADSRWKGARPTEAICRFCDKSFPLDRSRGRLQRTDTVWCPDCGRDSPDVQRFKKYKITKAQYDAACRLGCLICKRTDRKLHVDHDHACCAPNKARTCGKCVRGLICGPCNRGLGLFFDDPDALARAAQYLRGELML